MVALAQAATRSAPGRKARGGSIVLEQELRDLWLGGRGLLLSLAFSLLLSIIAYLVATNTALNFLEARESVNLTLQVAIAVGGLLALVAAADAVSGERERGTLETMLLTPVARLQVTGAKLVAAFSLWVVAFAITIPYVWFLGRGVGVVGDTLVTGIVVGTLLAVFLASLGIVVSLFSCSNRVSLSLSMFVVLALFAPTQLPSSAQPSSRSPRRCSARATCGCEPGIRDEGGAPGGCGGADAGCRGERCDRAARLRDRRPSS